MIIVEIKTRKQLKEAPLLDLINVGNAKKADYIGIRGSRRDPEPFKDISVSLYKNTKQNLVIILPSLTLMQILKKEVPLTIGTTSKGVTKTPPTIVKILKKNGINPDDVHVLIPSSEALPGDESEPNWTMVHDLIGHSLADEIAHSIMYSPKIMPVSEYEFEPYVIRFVRALYSGVSDELKTADIGDADEDDYFILFDAELGDDRWADILAAIALKEYDAWAALDYITTPNDPPWLRKHLKNLINYLLIEVEKRTHWLPGGTSFLRSW